MNLADLYFKDIVTKILNNGYKRRDRTGVGTIGLFGMQYHFQTETYFPLLSLRKIHVKSVVHELLWFLGAYDEKYEKFGNSNIFYLISNGVKFWSDWPYKEYIKKKEYRPELLDLTIKEFEEKIISDDDFALEFGSIGRGYGHQWKSWGQNTTEEIIKQGTDVVKDDEGNDFTVLKPDKLKITTTKGINQIDKVIEQLKKEPDSRRIIIETWNVTDLDDMLLPPCHKTIHLNTHKMADKERIYEFRKWSKENNINIEGLTLDDATYKFNFPTRRLSLLLYQRSVDTFLGWPFNVAEYTILLHMIAQVVNMIPDEMVWTGGDVHLYNNSIKASKEVSSRSTKSSPRLKLNPDIKNIYDFREKDIEIVNYNAHPNIKVDVAV